MSTHRLDAHTVRRIAVEACRDPRTVIAAYGGKARGVAVESVRAAALRLGLEPPTSQAVVDDDGNAGP